MLRLLFRVLPLLPFQRSLKVLSPHPGDTRLGWDLASPLLCIRDHPRGPHLPSGPEHLARGESSWSMPEPSPPPADQSSSPQLSPYSRITRSMFSCDSIPGNVNFPASDFHGESYYDMPALAANPRFRDLMRLVHRYSLLPFMTLRQFFYPRVVLEFYHTMTS